MCVTLRRGADGVLLFDPQLSFEGVAVVPTARVFIEAYYRTAFMRFDCGSVEDFVPPEDRRLTEIDGTSLVRFRMKETSGRVPLLPVNFDENLEHQAWRIEFEPEGPVLELNNRIDAIRDVARSDAAFFALVCPAAVRQVLTRILLVDEQDAHQDGDDWWNLWLRWAERYAAPLRRTATRPRSGSTR